jgi:hypothetical protein
MYKPSQMMTSEFTGQIANKPATLSARSSGKVYDGATALA